MKNPVFQSAMIAFVSALCGCSTAVAQRASEVAFARSAGDSVLQWGGCPPIFPAGCQIAVLHGDPAQPNADIFLRVPGGMELANHTHTSAERINLVSGELRVHYQGQEAVTLRVGDYAYGPAGLPHAARCVSQTPCTLFIAFEQPVDAHPHP
jgi:mannose-6-phosphate isomerase-like protein (cupin superfamily)